MAAKEKKKTKSSGYKILRRILLVLAVLLALGAAAALSLPAVLSSDWMRGRLADQIAQATGKPTSLKNLSFSWSDGLRLEALQVGRGDLSSPEFLVRLDMLHVDVGLLAALRGDVRAAVELHGLALRVPPKDPNEPEPPAKPLPEVLRALFATLRTGLEPVPLKLDAHVRVELSDMTLRLEPAPGGKALELHDVSLRLDAPGLASPLTLTADLDAWVDGSAVAQVRLSAKAEGLLDASGRLSPAQARLTAEARAPGLELTIAGSLAKALKLDLRADLREAAGPAHRLLAELPEVDGKVALGLSLSRPDKDHATIALVLFADALRASRGPLGAKAAGPFSLNLLQEAELDLSAQTARLPGQLELKPASRLLWQGELDGLAEDAPRVHLRLEPLHLALSGLLPAVRAFLPPGLGLGEAAMDAQSIDVTVLLPRPGEKPQVQAQATNLDLSARNIVRRAASGNMAIGGADLRIASLNATLPGDAPGQLQASLSASADAVRLDGKTPLSVGRFSLPRVELRLDALGLDGHALFGVTGQGALELAAQARDIEAKGKASIPGLEQSLRLRASLPASQAAQVNLEELSLTVPLLRVLQPGKKPMEAPLTLRASAPDIRLSGPAPLIPAVHGLDLKLELGEALRCAAQVSLAGPTGRDLRSEGHLSLDARKLLALAAPLVPRQAKASGELSLDWKLDAGLPAPPPQGKTPPGPKKLSQTLRELKAVRQAEAILRLDGLSLDWPLAATPGQAPEILRLRGLSTPRPLRLTSRDGAAESSLSGSLAFGPLDALPGVGQLTKPLSGLMTLNFAQQGARSVQFSEVLHLDGLELDQNLTLMLDKLDTVLDRDADRLAAVLERVDGTAGFRLTTGLNALPAALPGKAPRGLTGKGRLEAGAEAQLSGGRSLALSARLLSPGLDLSLGPDFAVSGLTSSLRLSRRFSLAPGLRCPGDMEAEPSLLSEQVFDLFPATPRAVSGSAEALGQLLRTDTAGPTGGAFGLARLKLKSGGLPLDIRDVQARLDTSGPVPGLRSFRAGLLGGNVLGSAMIRKNAGRYTLDTDLAFTGIDPGRLLPAKAPRDLGDKAETSGRLSLSVPLTPDPEALLQRLTLRLDITKIGPRTLERMLYALDPDEQNQTIVEQRRLMGIGYPRNLRVGAAYGNLSLSGAVDVKGFQLDLPQVDRLAIANLPLRSQLKAPLASIPALLKALDAASGSQICRNPADPQGALRVVQP